MPGVFTDYSQCVAQISRANSGILSWLRLRPVSFTHFPVHYSLINLPLDATSSDLQRASLNKQGPINETWGLETATVGDVLLCIVDFVSLVTGGIWKGFSKFMLLIISKHILQTALPPFRGRALKILFCKCLNHEYVLFHTFFYLRWYVDNVIRYKMYRKKLSVGT